MTSHIGAKKDRAWIKRTSLTYMPQHSGEPEDGNFGGSSTAGNLGPSGRNGVLARARYAAVSYKIERGESQTVTCYPNRRQGVATQGYRN